MSTQMLRMGPINSQDPCLYFIKQFMILHLSIGSNDMPPMGYEETDQFCLSATGSPTCKCWVEIGCESAECFANGQDGKCIGNILLLVCLSFRN